MSSITKAMSLSSVFTLFTDKSPHFSNLPYPLEFSSSFSSLCLFFNTTIRRFHIKGINFCILAQLTTCLYFTTIHIFHKNYPLGVMRTISASISSKIWGLYTKVGSVMNWSFKDTSFHSLTQDFDQEDNFAWTLPLLCLHQILLKYIERYGVHDHSQKYL